MNQKQRWAYIAYFRQFVQAEQVWDILELPVEVICDYILQMWEEFYEQNTKNSLNIHSKWLKSNQINYEILS